jgi:hypothetical protein
MTRSKPDPSGRTGRTIIAALAVWALAVAASAQSGVFASLFPPLIAVMVAATIVLPALVYFASPSLKAFADGVGHRPILAFHTWRIPAALLFFWYGANGALPPAFWVLAGLGDLIAGGWAAWLLFRPESEARYRAFHVFGSADFVLAVGTGLTFTLLQDPRMASVAVLPLALIPLFGVGISGVTHLVAFDMLRRGTSLKLAASTTGTSRRPAEVTPMAM